MEARLMLRSLLFVPGNDRSKMVKASRVSADAVILDWEDGVLPLDKAGARRATLDFLQQESCQHLAFVRFNPVGTRAFDDDVQTLEEYVPAGIVLSKCRSAADVMQLAATLDEVDPTGNCSIYPLVESPQGLMNISLIAGGSSRVSTVAFGAEDFSAEMGILRTEDDIELLFARSALVTACRAVGKEAIDSPCLEFRSLTRLKASVRRARNLGFTGQLAIHPDQIATINQTFTPSEADLTQARQLVNSFDSASSGVVGVEGRMVDEAVVRRARRILAMADQLRK